MSETTYTQVQDENGTIRYVPTAPPEGEPPSPGKGEEERSQYTPADERIKNMAEDAIGQADFQLDDTLTDTLRDLIANNKRLRYDRRLTRGKLDNRSLSHYKLTDRLFKLKAIKHKAYQFTFLIDTSGSMYDDEGSGSKLQVATEVVARAVKATEELELPSSVFTMNAETRRVKGFDQKFNEQDYRENLIASFAGGYYDNDDGHDDGDLGVNARGTSEHTAYTKAVEYADENTKPGVTNVFIILSDGEPGVSRSCEFSPYRVGHELVEMVKIDHEYNDNARLARFWTQREDILAFGLGIQSSASQVPTRRTIDDINELPRVMGDLLTELMM